MSARNIPASLRQQVIDRANGRCEYCRLPDDVAFYSPEIDHVIARKHGGQTTPDNLARICWRCNHHKGTDIATFDPQTNELTRLFNPRTDDWYKHFRLSNSELISDTPVGRATIFLLKLNRPDRVAERALLIEAGVYL
jgi:5-methylcytosine-specific restriction endonuclease McrA